MTVWLTSDDSMRWIDPRRVHVLDVRPGPEDGAEYARLEVAEDEPDAGTVLLARSRDGAEWVSPRPDRTARIMVWEVRDPDLVWTPVGVRPPTPRPTSWCVIAACREDAERVAAGVRGPR